MPRTILAATFIAIFFCNNAGAQVTPPAVADHAPSDKAPIHLVAAFDGVDNRMSDQEYASSHGMRLDDLEETIAASGHLQCGNVSGGAQVTHDQSTIVTVKHIMCEGRTPATKCTFTYKVQTELHTVQISKLVEAGSDCQNNNDALDWAVMKLQKPAIGVTPYLLDVDTVKNFGNMQKIQLVADQSIDFCNKIIQPRCINPVRIGPRPRYIVDCRIRYVAAPNGIPIQHANDCPVSYGASGGAILDRVYNHPTLLGVITTAPKMSVTEARMELRTGKTANHLFSLTGSNWYVLDTPLTGRFADAVRRSASE